MKIDWNKLENCALVRTDFFHYDNQTKIEKNEIFQFTLAVFHNVLCCMALTLLHREVPRSGNVHQEDSWAVPANK